MSRFLIQPLVDWADAYLDDDLRQAEYEQLGCSMFDKFGSDRGKVSSQVRNLQSITNSAVRFSDIELFIKNQMGRDNTPARQWRQLQPGPLEQLKRIAQQTDPKGQYCTLPENLRQPANDALVSFRLRLAGGWVRAVTAAYLFQKAQSEINLGAAE